MPRLRPLATLSAGAVLAALSPGADAAAADAAFGARALAQGARGEDVRALQELLTRAGIVTPVDGHFGPATRDGVRQWESRYPAAAPVLNGGAASARVAGAVRRDGRLSRREARLLRADVAAAEVGRTPAPPAPPIPPTPPTAIATATLGADGRAVAPESAPEAVRRMIAAGNEIHGTPYRYGGGHARRPNRDSGYDCSGSMSYVMQGAGLLSDSLDSSGFARFGEPGPGAWVTIYANADHSFMVIAGLRFDTSGRKDAGSRWQVGQRSGSGYAVRHPAGL